MHPDLASRGAIPPVPSADQPNPPKLLDYWPVFDAALSPDWQLLGRCRDGGGAPEGGCFVVAHPEVGVALVDLLPDHTPNAEALFRRLLNAVDFSARCRGYLPVVHCAVGPDELPALRGRIEEAFGYDSILTIADRGQWVSELWRVLQTGITWEALGRPPTGHNVGAATTETTASRFLPRGRLVRPLAGMARAGLLACGLLGLFGLGFAAALLLPPPEAPPQPPPTGTIALAEAPPVLTSLPPRPLPPVAQAEVPIETAPPVLPGREDTPADAAEAPPTGDTRTAALLPGVRRASRQPLPIDRRCSEALFRFQQGASLSSQDMAHVRQGCASWR